MYTADFGQNSAGVVSMTVKVRVACRSIPPPWAVDSISPGPPHVRPTWALSTCGEPDEIKKIPTRQTLSFFCDQGRRGQKITLLHAEILMHPPYAT